MPRFLTLIAIVLPLLAAAQPRIAIVNVEHIFNTLPQTAQAQQRLDDLNTSLKTEYRAMQSEFNKKYADYQRIALDDKVPQSIKERRMREIRDDDNAIQAFVDKTQAELDVKRQEYQAPIYDLIAHTIKQVGDEMKLTYVLDVSRTPVAYRGADAIDITERVLNMLTAKP